MTGTRADESQQVLVSATPASIVLPSPVISLTQAISTPTATRTQTPPGPTTLEALSEANVRANPDPESELLGTIRAGDIYPIIGRYFRWYQFQYDQSPTGTGWVFDELVQVIGDESSIIDLSEQVIPTSDNTAAALTATMEAITQTPGGILTATAGSLAILLPIEGESVVSPVDPQAPISVLPTFTYPAEVALVIPDNAYQVGDMLNVTATLNPDDVKDVVTTSAPPILPILFLISMGLLGLIIASRR